MRTQIDVVPGDLIRKWDKLEGFSLDTSLNLCNFDLQVHGMCRKPGSFFIGSLNVLKRTYEIGSQ